MALFSPSFGGTVRIQTPGGEFLGRLQRRIDAGFLSGMPHWRSRYVVTRHTDRELAFRAGDFFTAINVGLNEVEVRISDAPRLEYVVTYRRWAAYGVVLGALIGMLLMVSFFVFPHELGGMDRTGAAIFWGMVGFWGFIWPWVLIAMHKPFARQCLNRILAEIDGQAG